MLLMQARGQDIGGCSSLSTFVLIDISDGYVHDDLSIAGVVTGMLNSH